MDNHRAGLRIGPALAGMVVLAAVLSYQAGASAITGDGPAERVNAQEQANDVAVMISNSLQVEAPEALLHTEAITISVTNGPVPTDVAVSVSVLGPAPCLPLLLPEVGDVNTTADVLTGPIVVAGQQSTRLDFNERFMQANEGRSTVREYTLECAAGGPYSMQMIANVSSLLPDPDITNNQAQNHPLVTVCCPDVDGDAISNGSDNCTFAPNVDQANHDTDAFGDACDEDDDNDRSPDGLEGLCGSDSLRFDRVPERVDGVFFGADDDGDMEIDEVLPPTASVYDCDQDGYVGERETHIYGGATSGDQDPCGHEGWPSDLVPGASPNALTIEDVASFVAPARRLGTSQSDPVFDVRWDLVPGTVVGEEINYIDLAALIAGTTGYPPMFANARALGKSCPWP